MSKIARYGLACSFSESKCASLETSPFSICVDEWNDKLGKEFLVIEAVDFEKETSNFPQTQFLGLIELGESSTGEVLSNKVNKFLFERKNGDQIGMASDHNSNFISGGEKGLAESLKKDIPHLFVIQDYAHIFNLVVGQALSIFPQDIVPMIKKICSKFSRSPHNKAI